MQFVRFTAILALCLLAIAPLAAKDDGIEILPDHHFRFPITEVGSSTTLTLRIVNRTQSSVRFSGIAEFDRGDAQHFTVGTTPTAPIPSGASAQFTVTFHPVANGEFAAEYDLPYILDDGKSGKQSLELFGRTLRDLYIGANDIDFQTVTTAVLHTSEVLLRNRGYRNALLRAVEFPPNSEVFSFEAPSTPELVYPNSNIKLRFGFHPLKPGTYQTRAVLVCQDAGFGGPDEIYRIPINLRGTLAVTGGPAPQPRLEVLPEEINFGIVTTASVVSALITVSNTTGTANATVGSVVVSTPAFALERWSGPVTVTAGTQVQFAVSFSPKADGVYTTTAIVQTSVGAFPVVLKGELNSQSSGHVYSAAVTVPSITASVGKEFELPIILDSMSSAALSRIASCRVVFRFNSTLMALGAGVQTDTDSIDGGIRTLAVVNTISNPVPGSALFSVPMLAALGDAESTAIDIVDVDWFDNNSTQLAVSTSLGSGRLVIDDLWRYGGVRLVSSNAGALVMDILPNPVVDKATFRLSFQLPAALVIYDVMGNAALTLTDQLPPPGANIVAFQADVSSLPAGTYYCRLSSGKFSLVRTMRIE